MSRQKFKITNWSAYNNALSQRGSLTVRPDESAIAAWTDNAQPEGRGWPLHYTDMAITTVLMMKRVFNLPLRALQGFVDSIFKLMELPLCCPDYSLVSKRAKTVNISIKTPTRGEISHLIIDSTGQKVFGEGEWKVRQHGADRRRVWRKLHLTADGATLEIICADLSLSGTTDAQALPGLINQTHRKIREASADGAYDTRYCHDALLRKKIRPLIPPRSGAQYWPDKYHARNHTVANQHLSGSNDLWKKKVDYHRRSVAETAMFRIKTLLGGNLSLRDYDAQVGEAMARVKALNRMTLLGMPHSVRST
ncbi:IS5 family transposase [Salmonella enterica]|nr:IS5 family transposase [Salmonella enterica]EBR3854011.1 IS5 family transposase [Salmonella enterica subsp. enterica]ECH9400664.1 IS5 family transposase [Salmonella enterica subsp. diarizonae]ECT9714848.1 IS5 family transposase [Salmonella enterica subsp. diarizonae str. CFSAN000553]EGE4751121.1 IS5 family transposase [Salmonella enterica subsp. diarizonae serovar 38:[k]:z35]HAF0276670.1 IS5 family transposase [Salmonella enterica subsp. diarizonae serovar 38:[k]:z35:-]HCA3617731.1 IS5 fam